jgi:hypothetical protein
MGGVMDYELETAVVVEDSILGERFRYEGGPGRVKPKNEREELALQRLAEQRPDVCRAVKPAPKGKG